eukprot:1227296-Heterocapsa_arctica.AAC.1
MNSEPSRGRTRRRRRRLQRKVPEAQGSRAFPHLPRQRGDPGASSCGSQRTGGRQGSARGRRAGTAQGSAP